MKLKVADFLSIYDPLLPPGMRELTYVFTEAANESCSVKKAIKKCNSSTAAVNFFLKKTCEELAKL